MHKVTGCLELASLSSEVAVTYLKHAEDEFTTVVEKLEDCLKLINGLRQYEIFSYKGQHPDNREYVIEFNRN